MTQLIPSTAAGKAWNVYIHKPAGRPAYAAAVEVTPMDHGFQYDPFHARSLKVPISSPATAKRKAAAHEILLKNLKEQGLIA